MSQKRRILVAGNWKMNGGLDSAKSLVEEIKAGMDKVKNAEVAICPPFVYIPTVGSLIAGTDIALGAQNVAKEDPGAFTGEVAAPMLTDIGCKYVIVGHSERRAYYGETDSLVAQKFVRAQKEGLTPIVCVGELLEEREAGKTEQVVARQLGAIIEAAGASALEKSVIAYEPVWAIGTGKTATPDQARDVHAFIRSKIADKDAGVAEKVRIQYGGSVNAGNAAELFAMPDIDGGLIGGASLKSADFLTICAAG
uniref:Triosephosphate isomerase n=1 Tax=Candidatus Kentrum sp. TC TaxID=2126339 RepID=A0A450YEX3_9GAMM|nr:MAG: triosephosphate isomerase (TIM) [Candidatus Kentron sp. TC]VFK48764.1 MAG: triosephosphate isomerase [Candidatus Kentron sp. TC]VFK62788.1 MAG: triosephosphate isomerase (TIM) [Candidatus Kentron sp. TC]